MARPVDVLVRVRRDDRGALVLGPGPGRGAWLCRDRVLECLEVAARRGAFSRALRAAVRTDDVEALRAKLREWSADRRPGPSEGEGGPDRPGREIDKSNEEQLSREQ